MPNAIELLYPEYEALGIMYKSHSLKRLEEMKAGIWRNAYSGTDGPVLMDSHNHSVKVAQWRFCSLIILPNDWIQAIKPAICQILLYIKRIVDLL